MHTIFGKIYIFILIIWAVEKSNCKQETSCLRYGHSCWGAHGKRNGDLSNNRNLGLLYRMALVQKSTDKDSFDVEETRSQEEDIPDYFNILKKYIKRNPKKSNSNDNDNINTWNVRASKYVPDDRYYEDQVLDPRIEYRLIVN